MCIETSLLKKNNELMILFIYLLPLACPSDRPTDRPSGEDLILRRRKMGKKREKTKKKKKERKKICENGDE